MRNYIKQIKNGKLDRDGVNRLKDTMPFEEWNDLRIAVNDCNDKRNESKIEQLNHGAEKIDLKLRALEKEVDEIRDLVSNIMEEVVDIGNHKYTELSRKIDAIENKLNV